MNVNHSFLLHTGNRNIHTLTSSGNYELYIENKYFGWPETYFARYRSFNIDDTNSDYELHVDGFSGNDSMALQIYLVHLLLKCSFMQPSYINK